MSVIVDKTDWDCGIGFVKLSNYFGDTNMPPPMHLETYQKTATSMHDASNAMEGAAKAVRKVQEKEAQD